jgi:hypothetical protein
MCHDRYRSGLPVEGPGGDREIFCSVLYNLAAAQ